MDPASVVIDGFLREEFVNKDFVTVGYQTGKDDILELKLEEFLEALQNNHDRSSDFEDAYQILYFRYRSWLVWNSITALPFREVRAQCSQADRCAELLTQLDAVRPVINGQPLGTATLGSNTSQSCSILPMVSQHMDLVNSFWYSPDSPNFFLCHRVQSAAFRQMAQRVQARLGQYSRLFPNLFEPPERWHLTLCAFSLQDLYQVHDCFSLIHDTIENMRKWLPTCPVKLRGISSYRNRMLFVNAIEDVNLKKLTRIIRQTMSTVGFATNSDEDFIPHVTLMKLNPRIHRQLQIPDDVLDEFCDADFGLLEISELHFCFRSRGSDPDGFYPTYGRIQLNEGINGTLQSLRTHSSSLSSEQPTSVKTMS